uniref:Uncharacterized protein n=1 Tax=Manihot esculenta TaxID=3983 RepID=A0A2C9W876_MANES
MVRQKESNIAEEIMYSLVSLLEQFPLMNEFYKHISMDLDTFLNLVCKIEIFLRLKQKLLITISDDVISLRQETITHVLLHSFQTPHGIYRAEADARFFQEHI